MHMLSEPARAEQVYIVLNLWLLLIQSYLCQNFNDILYSDLYVE
jgi:hypothetical protein